MSFAPVCDLINTLTGLVGNLPGSLTGDPLVSPLVSLPARRSFELTGQTPFEFIWTFSRQLSFQSAFMSGRAMNKTQNPPTKTVIGGDFAL